MKATQWETHVRAQTKSGLSQKAYCTRHGLKLGTFSYWTTKLRQAEASRESGFIEIGSSAPLEIVTGKVTIRVPHGYNVDALLRLLEGLSC